MMGNRVSINHQHTGETSVARKEKGTFELIVGGMLLLALIPVLLAGCSSSDDAVNTYTGGELAGVHYIDANNLDVTVTSISVAADADGFPVVSFHVDAGGADYTALKAGDVRLYMADLVPAGTAAVDPAAPEDPLKDLGTFPSPYYERWAYERSTAGNGSITSQTAFTSFDATDAANGNYQVTMSTGFGSAEALVLAPELDPTTHPQRLFMRVGGKTLADGSVTNNTVGILDFMVPANGATATETLGDAFQYQKAYVTIGACKKCHGPKMANAAHANGYLDTRACVICHSPIGVYGYEMQPDSAYLTVFLHKIHSGIAIPQFDAARFPEIANGEVTFPQPGNCVVCHSDPDGLAAGSAAMLDNWKDHATVEACGSCHTEDDYVTGINPDAASVVESHDPTAAAGYDPAADPNAPEFDVTMSITPPDNGPYYVEGETPVITVTLKNHATGVNFTNYTTAKDAAGVSGGGLSTAILYVYGPRNGAAPVLTLNASADQGENLFLPSTDLNVLTDATGFHYQLQAIPAGMTAGTYMASVQMADYGGLSDTDYKTTSVGDVLYFQVGTADLTPNVAGDACYNCHGETHMHQAGSHAHNVPFNTDYCNACHDTTGIHGVPIANRAHAVHSANPKGDLYNYVGGVYTLNATRDWETIFPRTDGDCSACHVSGNTSYRTNIYGVPCLGCHGDNNGVNDHMAQMGFIFSNRKDFSSTDSCVACHGSGKSVDVSDVKGP